MSIARCTLLVLMVLSGAKSAFAAAELRSAQPEIVCHNEIVFLDIWQALNTISHMEYSGAKARIIVHGKAWRKSTAELRKKIALAAYCRIRVEYGGGTVDVMTSVTGPSRGTVTDGYWHDSLTD
ncbi:hypothetical protein MUO32_14110 [Shinella sp. CPCC 101442]|uniref:hypothetical protein n=1 Tax=Shinella sp. CPCC 101442 TaxID=2932265 RepID=UPI002152D51B|nr:hypothetical protein [Shinella sp. CPCC 101442]MCR6500179.1 hypothetical protein [Shinella sp. CPCC 101442]